MLMLFLCSLFTHVKTFGITTQSEVSDFFRTEKWAGSWLYLHWDRFGEQLHSTKERTLRGVVHGLHPPRAATEGLTNTAAPTWSPFHEEATEGAAAGPP